MTPDRPTRFIAAWRLGPSEAAAAPAVVVQPRARTAERAGGPWVSEGHDADRQARRRVYRDPVRTGRRGRRLVRVAVRGVQGEPMAGPYTVHVERSTAWCATDWPV